jgi:hypothetical protein
VKHPHDDDELFMVVLFGMMLLMFLTLCVAESAQP